MTSFLNTWACHDVALPGRLNGVSLALRAGEVCALIGPSAAGKSSLLWAFAGLLNPSEGRVGTRPGAEPGALGMVFQDGALWDHLTVRQHAALVARNPQTIDRVLRDTHLEALANRRPGELSGGQKQRLALARALAVEPRWLLLDEPTAHLDGAAREEVLSLLRGQLATTEAGVLLATHHADEAMQLADRIAVMITGRIVQEGPPAEVYHRPVSLEAARLLGPASAVRTIPGGDGAALEVRPVSSSLTAARAHDIFQIARPEHLDFASEPDGPARVERCDFNGAGYLLLVTIDDHLLTVASPIPFTISTAGRVRWTPPSSPQNY